MISKNNLLNSAKTSVFFFTITFFLGALYLLFNLAFKALSSFGLPNFQSILLFTTLVSLVIVISLFVLLVIFNQDKTAVFAHHQSYHFGHKFLFLILPFGLLGLIFVSFLFWQKLLVNKYVKIVGQSVELNPQAYQRIFQDEFFFKAASCSPTETPVCNQEIVAALHQALPSSLIDLSSTLLIRLQQNQITKLYLTGELKTESYRYTKEWAYLVNLLEDRETKIVPGDYFYDIPGREIVIPVRVNGTIIGAVAKKI